VNLGVWGICSPTYAKISRRNLQYPAACGGDSLFPYVVRNYGRVYRTAGAFNHRISKKWHINPLSMSFTGLRVMSKFPFSIFRRSRRRFFYVSFKNEKIGEYLPAISTKQEAGAIKTAFEWLKDGIPRQGGGHP
jgi:hypothetical protein